jgi:plasmid stability protein
MSQILVRNLAPEVVERLKQRAERNRRSLEAEVRSILEEISAREQQERRIDEFLRIADAIRSQAGLQLSDSTDLIREDRDDPNR